MSQPTVDPYLEMLVRSGLVPNDQLEALIAPYVAPDGSLGEMPSGDTLGRQLVDQSKITAWQHERLLEGQFDFYIDKYKLVKLLGQGGMGQVYLAEHQTMNRLVAIKVLPTALVDSPSHLQRFYQESRATARLSHPNIVQAFDVDEDAHRGLHYLVMEYIEGRDLQRVVMDDGPLSPKRAAEYVRQAARGLAHAHERGLVHRDVKPSNLLVDPKGNVKILDLGIARIAPHNEEPSLTLASDNQVMGTIDYLAPEQLHDAHRVDGRADIYALGCTLFYLLMGHPPFNHGTLIQRMMAHQMQPPPDPHDVRPEVPRALADIVLTMLAKKPEDRYQSAQVVEDVLEAWLGNRKRSVRSRGGPLSSALGEGSLDSAVSGEYSSTPPPSAADAMISRLVEHKILTPFQMDVLQGRASEPLSVRGYHLLDRITVGRLSGMYRGRHGTHQFPVALKLVKLAAAGQEREDQLAQFEHEARVSSQVIHPNVVRTFDVGREGEYLFYALENLEGRSLAETLASSRRPSVAEACRMMRDAALGLAHLHEMEIVHRNVAPGNFWVCESSGTVKLMDLSLARDSLYYLNSKPMEEVVSHGNEVLGSPDYLAPEQAIECQSATYLSDIYGLGCTLYHALTGRVPFTSASPSKLMLKHATLMPPAPSSFNPHVPAELDEFTLLMMAKSPDRRVRTAALVAQVLEMFSKGS